MEGNQEAKVKIKAVAIDMSPAYIKSVTDHIGYDKIVFDWFHIKKKINFEIDELRREMYNEEKRLGIRQVMKGSRWLLLKNSENLNAEKDEKQKLEKVRQRSKPLATMYCMKEELTTMVVGWKSKI
ncbi:MAG: transposase [Saprospiraceae bacterium]|nr:transposase [Saprospiraceae bacterium]